MGFSTGCVAAARCDIRATPFDQPRPLLSSFAPQAGIHAASFLVLGASGLDPPPKRARDFFWRIHSRSGSFETGFFTNSSLVLTSRHGVGGPVSSGGDPRRRAARCSPEICFAGAGLVLGWWVVSRRFGPRSRKDRFELIGPASSLGQPVARVYDRNDPRPRRPAADTVLAVSAWCSANLPDRRSPSPLSDQFARQSEMSIRTSKELAVALRGEVADVLARVQAIDI